MKFQKRIVVPDSVILIDLLASNCDASRSSLKDCLTKGGVWRKGSGRKELRVRRAKSQLRKGDLITICYDESILKLSPPRVQPLVTESHYSIWNKPSQLLTQGTRFGDHCSLLRIAEKSLNNHKPFLIHRLDREACGLVMLAHGSRAAGKLSALFQNRDIVKRYLAVVHGSLGSTGDICCIEQPLDGKPALTEYRVLEQKSDRTSLQVEIKTGRFHQIRKHLSGIGHPLVGDKQYGSRAGREQLHLAANELHFKCPFTNEDKSYRLDKGEIPFAGNYF